MIARLWIAAATLLLLAALTCTTAGADGWQVHSGELKHVDADTL
jgi:hypothetical protein